jgi:hypothetical protein
MKTALRVLLSVFVLALAGCSTVGSRIKEHATEFNQLDPETQTKIRQGTVAVGFTPNMVYMALGAPDAKRHRLSRGGSTETWIYNTYYQTYEGTQLVDYHRWYRYDRFHRRYFVYWGPAYADVYRTHREEKIRVTFRDGEVASIDQGMHS